MTEAEVLQALERRRSGFSLPGAFYSDPEIFALDMRAIFHRNWLFAGAACEIPHPGDYMTLSIGETPILVLRDAEGTLRGFFNSCRHRGARICDAEHGHSRALVCPYHRWTYKLDGRLAHASFMPADFDTTEFPLRPIHVRDVAGTIYVCLAEIPPDIEPYAAALEQHLAPHALHRAKLAAETHLIEEGNWKLVMENSRECYHCRTQHKELMRTFLDIIDFEDAATMATLRAYWDRIGALGLPTHIAEGPDFRASRLPFTGGAVSITNDGKPAVTRLLGDAPANDIGSLRWSHYPSVFNHALGDYAALVRMLPLGPQRTLVTTKYLVDQDAVEGRGYDVTRLTEIWEATNRQDRALVERNQAGVNSIGYRPGPYSPKLESGLIKFTGWYAGRILDYLAPETSRAMAAE